MVLPFESMDYGEDRIGATKVNELTDVSITDLANNEILKYNSTSGKWENQADSAGGGSLENLTDVNISNLANDNILRYNSTNNVWENESFSINVSELGDVNITSISDGELLKYNSTSSKFENANLNVSELGDVSITNIGNGELLKYNTSSSKFENANLTLEELNNVNITNLANGEVLKYDSATSKWINSDRIDTLNELNDVTVSSPANNQVLKYNSTSSKFVNTTVNLTELGDTNISTLNNGDLLKYDGDNWTTLTPTYLDGAGISDAFHIKVSSNSAVQSKLKEASSLNDTELKVFTDTGVFSVVSGIIKAHYADSKNKLTLSANNNNILTKGLTITEDGRVGIGIDSPSENLEIDGSIQIDSANVSRLKFEKSGQNPHSEAEIDGEEDGTNGGMLEFYTKVDGGSLTEKLRINNAGAVGIGGANYGTSGQILSSNGSGSAVSWIDAPTDTDTTYSAGTGMSLVGTTFSIGQAVANSSSPSFTQLTIGNTGTEQGILNLQDLTNVGTATIAQIKTAKRGDNAGTLEFLTKVNDGSLTERLKIKDNGNVGIGETDPQSKLHVDGGILATGDIDTEGHILLSSFGNSIKMDAGSQTGPVELYLENRDNVNPGIRIKATYARMRNNTGGDTSVFDANRLTARGVEAYTFKPTYGSLPNFTGMIGQTVGAGQPDKTLVFNTSVEVRSLTIPYTGVWLITFAMLLGNATSIVGPLYPTSVRINGNVTQNFYGNSALGVHGSIVRLLGNGAVVSFNTFLTGTNSNTMTAQQRGVWKSGYTFLNAVRIA